MSHFNDIDMCLLLHIFLKKLGGEVVPIADLVLICYLPPDFHGDEQPKGGPFLLRGVSERGWVGVIFFEVIF